VPYLPCSNGILSHPMGPHLFCNPIHLRSNLYGQWTHKRRQPALQTTSSHFPIGWTGYSLTQPLHLPPAQQSTHPTRPSQTPIYPVSEKPGAASVSLFHTTQVDSTFPGRYLPKHVTSLTQFSKVGNSQSTIAICRCLDSSSKSCLKYWKITLRTQIRILYSH
jgi:hypothetical protein